MYIKIFEEANPDTLRVRSNYDSNFKPWGI